MARNLISLYHPPAVESNGNWYFPEIRRFTKRPITFPLSTSSVVERGNRFFPPLYQTKIKLVKYDFCIQNVITQRYICSGLPL